LNGTWANEFSRCEVYCDLTLEEYALKSEEMVRRGLKNTNPRHFKGGG
jgi:hypothetical protein